MDATGIAIGRAQVQHAFQRNAWRRRISARILVRADSAGVDNQLFFEVVILLGEAMSDEAGKADDGIAGVFGRAAATFDRIGFFSHFGERLVEWAQLAAGDNVLDVATGRGASAFPAAERVGLQGRVVGTDISPEMLRETTKDVQSGHWQNIELQQVDAERLQHADGTFDCVLCGFALWFFPHPDRALQQFYRVLKPGGRLALTTWAQDSPMHNLQRDTLHPYLIPPSRPNDAGKKQRFDTKEQLETALRQSGFVDAKVFTEDFKAIVAETDPFWEQLWAGGNRGALERMTASTLEAVKSSFYQNLQTLRQPNGIHAEYRAMFALASK
jgi:ubiquinone/menaquinone biosynthesis C-methylase UbiE